MERNKERRPASHDQEANTVAKVLFAEIISNYSLPRAIVTDREANLPGEVFKSIIYY